MRLGIIGGTFNPIHNMHVQLAKSAKEELNLDKVIFITASDPPHKSTADGVTALDRLHMTELAIKGIDGFESSPMELNRKGKSYSVYTLQELRRIYPDDEIYFIIGGDSLNYLHKWYHAEELMKLCIFAVYPRGEDDGEQLKTECQWLYDTYGTKTVILHEKALEISSTEIRTNISNNVKGWEQSVPTAVADYIKEHNLYKGEQ